MAVRFHQTASESVSNSNGIPGFGHVLDAGTHRNSLISHAPRGIACNNIFELFILMYEKLVPGRLFPHQVLQSNKMNVPNGYDGAPFSGSPTSTPSTHLLNCENNMSADTAQQAENSATTATRLERVPVENSASASGSGTNPSSSHLQPININMSAVEPAPIEETGANTSSSGSYQSSTALSQPNHPHFSVQSAGEGSKAATEQHVEADGACTSSSGSSHPSTSSAQEGGGSSTSGVSPSRKRS
jgi:hypothetical protein